MVQAAKCEGWASERSERAVNHPGELCGFFTARDGVPSLAQLPQLRHEDFFRGGRFRVPTRQRGVRIEKPDVVKTQLLAGPG